MKFNLDDYKGKYAMWCPTEKEAKSFCKFLDDNNRAWISGDKYPTDNHWSVYEDQTCYFFNEGTYVYYTYAQQAEFIILRWNNFEESGNIMNDNNNNNNDEKIIIQISDYSENYDTRYYKIPKNSYKLLKTLDNDFELFSNDTRMSIINADEIEEF